jgi:hypothetical protein
MGGQSIRSKLIKKVPERGFFILPYPKHSLSLYSQNDKNMTTTTTTLDRVRNYEGQNSFVLKMKNVIAKYNGLTPNQLEAVEKCLNAVTTVKVEEMTEEMKRIVEYTGENTFVKDIASKFQKYGTLTEKQKSVALTQIQKEEMQTQSEETIPKEVLPEIPPIPTELETQPSDINSTSPNVLPTIIEEDEGKDEEGIVTDVPETPVISESLPVAPEIAEPQNPPPVVTKSPQVRISKRGTSTWKDGPARLVKPLQGSQPAANSSEGAATNSADITRQEGGIINCTKCYDKKSKPGGDWAHSTLSVTSQLEL